MIGRLDTGAVDKFLRQHHFSGIDHCRRVNGLPFSRRCCPLSLAAERDDVQMVVMLLNHGADPLLPKTLRGKRQESARGQQEARRLLDLAASAAEGQADQVLALQMTLEPWAFSGIYRLAGVIGREWEEPLLRELQQDDPLLL